MNNLATKRPSERGSAGVKFAITLVIIILTGHAGFNYIPTAYDAESLKSEMSTAVLQGLALPGKVNPVDNVKTRIQKAIVQNNIPTDAIMDVKLNGNVLTARVAYVKQVDILPFGIYRYAYQFDHTATPSGFLLKQ
ncbi:MAG: hypothetical protein IPL32_03050 [Chloracidobacterium sp.]|nr:hypothetical protein [Chloracidobacterium sp.]